MLRLRMRVCLEWITKRERRRVGDAGWGEERSERKSERRNGNLTCIGIW